ncbi:MAG: glycosyltransferase family 4 protein [Candidatus Binatia bacterium]
MRILTVTHYQPPHWGGIENTAAALHGCFQRLGHEAVWLSSDLPPAPAVRAQVRVPASDLPYNVLGVAYPLWGARAAAAMRRWVQWCDVVHPHDCLYPGTLLALRWARRLGKPLVLTQHAGPWPFFHSAVLRAAQLGAYRTLGLAVHRRVAQATFSTRTAQSWFAARVRYALPPRFIGNGVDAGMFFHGDADARQAARQRRGLPARRRIALYVGRFLSMKGLPVIEQLARRLPDTLFVLHGAGPVNPSSWGLPNVAVVRYAGQDVLRDYYWASDVMILPSAAEGFPLVVMEAMACGCPAIVSPHTYAAWDTGREHFLVAEPAPTADAIAELLAAPQGALEPEARGAISAYARAQWDWQRAARAYVELFETLRAGAG